MQNPKNTLWNILAALIEHDGYRRIIWTWLTTKLTNKELSKGLNTIKDILNQDGKESNKKNKQY